MGLSISPNSGVAQAWSQDSDSDFAGSESSESAASEPQFSQISQQAVDAYNGESGFDSGDDGGGDGGGDDDPRHSPTQTGRPGGGRPPRRRR
ncbi:MAG TPA: hypothetical protein VIG99_09940 [Myxococcaceae bacterium]|jgi:hypothetical protein